MFNDYKESIGLLIPGYLQGITRVCISYPFDYIRIKLQSNQERNAIEALQKNSRNLFRGLFIPLFAVPLDRSISFAVYEKLKNNYDSPFVASLVPSIVSNIYMVPINSINSNYIYNNKLDFKKTIAKNLNNQIYNGYNVEILRNTISSFLFLYSYNIFSKYNDNSFINGTMASLSMWSVVYPLDTIKTNKFIFKDKRYLDIIKSLDIRRAYSGIGLVFLRAFPSAGGGMYVYENVKEFLKYD
tara:strand:- start:8528 stop:9253 length:726 start_codon:yes stop_codon:yes gene_type:complete